MFNTCSFYDKMDLEERSKQYLSVFKSKEKKKEIGLQVYIYLKKKHCKTLNMQKWHNWNVAKNNSQN